MSGVLAYHLLRSALNRFGRSPAELSADERLSVSSQAEREYAVEARVLSAPEACDAAIPDAVVSDALRGITDRYGNGEELAADLKRNGLDLARLRRAVERQLRVEAVIERVLAGVSVTEEEVRSWYTAHPEQFRRPETRTARHILVTVNPDFPENTGQAARSRCEAIAHRLEKGEPFETLARAHSECPTAMEGGLLGRVPRGRLYPELEQVLFELAEGEIAGPVRTEIGFHLLRCDRIEPPQHLPLEEVRDRLGEKLLESRRQAYLRRWLHRPPSA